MISEQKYLSVQEVAELLSLDQQTIRRWVKNGRLPAIKPGKSWRIAAEDLDSLIENTSRRGGPGGPLADAAEDPETRRTLAPIRPLTMLMDEQAEVWDAVARSGDVGDELYHEILDKRHRVLRATDVLLASLSGMGLLEWGDRTHRPSRRAQSELQAAFNRWNRAFHDVAVMHFDSAMKPEPQTADEKRVAAWFAEAS